MLRQNGIAGPPLPMPAGVVEGRAADLALTALIIQAFYSSGYDHRTPNRYRRTVVAALDWLRREIDAGLDGDNNQAPLDSALIAIIARPIVEAFAMTQDPALRQPAQALIHRLLAEQLQWQGQWLGWGWQEHDDAGNPYPVVDAERSLQVALTLASALGAGLDIAHPRLAREPRQQVDSLAALRESMLAAVTNGQLPQQWSPARDLAMAAVEPSVALRLAAVVRQLDHGEQWAEDVSLGALPEQEPLDLRNLLWASEGLFIMSQVHWPDWNERLRDPLIRRQEREGRNGQGVWDGLWSIDGPLNDHLGPLASTALATNILQVYYRYLPDDWRHQRSITQPAMRSAIVMSPHYHGRNRDRGRDATWLWTVARSSDANGRISVPLRSVGAHGEWELNADVLDQSGNLSQLNASVSISRPLALDLRLPHRLVKGDRVTSTLLIHGEPGQSVRLEGAHTPSQVMLDGDGLGHIPLQLYADSSMGLPLFIRARQGHASDHLRATIPVVEGTAPWRDTIGGHLSVNAQNARTVTIPEALSGLSVQLQLPRPLAERAQASHAALIRSPHGCFEQTSATTYPLAVAHAAIQRSGAQTRDLERSLQALTDGYQRLLSFECADGGFEWFGRGAGHSGLTAFGLLQFHDLAAVGVTVDQRMITRTRNWLLSRIDSTTGAVQSSGQRSLHGWDEAGPLLDLYVAWALASSAGELPAALLQRLHSLPIAGAWQHSLAAETWARLGYPQQARNALKAISWDDDHLVAEPGTAVIRSDTRSQRIEASARALISGLQLGDDHQSWLSVYHAISGHEQHGRFGSTQATVQALRALALIEERLGGRSIQGTLTLVSNGGSAQSITVGDGHPTSVPISDLRPGSNQLSVTWQGNQDLTWTIDLSGNLERPDNPPAAPLELIISPLPEGLRLGDAVDVQVQVIAHQDTPTPMARLGLPAGLLPRPDQLDELVNAGTIAAWESHGPHLVLYWRQLPAGKHHISIATVADMAGNYRGVASSIQPYYQEDLRHWHPSISLQIDRE